MMIPGKFLAFGLVLSLLSCNGKLTPNEYVEKYLRDARTIQEQGGIEVSGMVLSDEFLAARAWSSLDSANQMGYPTVQHSNPKLVRFQIEIRPKTPETWPAWSGSATKIFRQGVTEWLHLNCPDGTSNPALSVNVPPRSSEIAHSFGAVAIFSATSINGAPLDLETCEVMLDSNPFCPLPVRLKIAKQPSFHLASE
jgi:hypothetical protein